MQEWRVIEDGPKDGESNMAIDRAILASCASGKTLPTLRLYSWERPTLTVGYAQDFAKEIDVNRCRKLGIQIVRRPTGGRALLHNHEVTYSLTAPIPHSKFPPSLLGAYKVVARALLEGLKEIGVCGSDLASGGKPNRGRHSFHSPSCLSSINHLEIEVQGAKLVGSAQRRTKRAFLQHGSMLLDWDRALLNSLFKTFITLSGSSISILCSKTSFILWSGFSTTLVSPKTSQTSKDECRTGTNKSLSQCKSLSLRQEL